MIKFPTFVLWSILPSIYQTIKYFKNFSIFHQIWDNELWFHWLWNLVIWFMAITAKMKSLRVFECMNYFLNVTTVHCFIGSPLYDSCALYYYTMHWEAVIEMLNIHCFFLCWQCWGGANRNLYFDWQHDWANQRPGYSQYTRLLIKYSSAEKLPCANWGMTKFLIHVPQRYTVYTRL